MDLASMAFAHQHSFTSAESFQHVVTPKAQNITVEPSYTLIIFYNQNCLPPKRGIQPDCRLLLLEAGVRSRQQNVNCGSLAWLAIHPDVSPALNDDPVNC